MFASGVSIRCVCAAVLLAGSIGWPAATVAQVARAIETRGAAVVERAGAPPRILGLNEPLDRRDTIHVAHDSWAVLEFSDGSRITLRPDTVFRIDAWQDDRPGSAVLGLIKGGFRAVTGMIGRRNPRAMQFQVGTATIGIRGTEFIARLCDTDCASEARVAPPVANPVAARLGASAGGVSAIRPDGRWRGLSLGDPVYIDDAVVTGSGGAAVLFFPDGTRLALEPGSVLIVDRYVWDGAEGDAVFMLLDGVSDITTGTIARQDSRRFRFFTPDGEIRFLGTRIRVQSELQRSQVAGSSLSSQPATASIPGESAGGTTKVTVFSGEVAMLAATGVTTIPAGQAATVAPAGVVLAPAAADNGIRSDAFHANAALFGAPSGAVAPGLFVGVVEGKVSIGGSGGAQIVLGPGEAARMNRDGSGLTKLANMPGFLAADLFIAPGGANSVSCAPAGSTLGGKLGGTSRGNLMIDTSNLKIGLDPTSFPAGPVETPNKMNIPDRPGGGPDGKFSPGGEGQGSSLGGGKIKPAVSLTSRHRTGFMGSGMNQGEVMSGKWSSGRTGSGFRGPSRGQAASGDGDDDMAGLIAQMLTDEGGTPTGDPKADAAELAYAQSVGTDGYAATKNMTAEQREEYWAAQAEGQRWGAIRPREDDVGSTHAFPVVMNRADARRVRSEIGRQIGSAIGRAGGPGDGRTDQQAGSGGGGGIAMQRGTQLGIPDGEGGTGTVNMNAVLRLDPLVNFY